MDLGRSVMGLGIQPRVKCKVTAVILHGVVSRRLEPPLDVVRELPAESGGKPS